MIKKIKILSLIFLTFCVVNIYPQENKIALLYSKYTENLMKSDSNWVNDQITFWELFLIENKFNYDVVYDGDLESGLSNDYSTLIIPLGKALSDEEISSIKDFINNGRSILVSGSLGVYNEAGKLRGWNSLEDLFGIKFESEIQKEEVSRIHSIFGGNPLSVNIPVGFRLQVTTYKTPIEAKVISPDTKPLGYWYSSNIPYEGKSKAENTTAIAYGSNVGKFIWMGFDMTSVAVMKVHQDVLKNLLLNSLTYLNNEPAAWIETWQNGKKSAVILSADVEFQFEKIQHALDIMERQNVTGQFFILTDVIKTESLNRMTKFGDLGVHGDNHNLFKWQDFNIQYSRLKNSINILEEAIDRKVISFRPPETRYDEETIKALKQLNIKILSADFIEDRSVPQYYNDDKELLIIPKTGYDDYDIFYNLKIKSYVEQAERYLLDYKRTYEEGGLYNLYYHSQMQCLKEYVGALEICINQFKSDNAWITTADKVRDWWLLKNNLNLTVKDNNNGQFSVEIRNGSSSDVKDIVISFVKNNLDDNISVKESRGMNADFTYEPIEKKVRININSIPSYGTINFIIASGNI